MIDSQKIIKDFVESEINSSKVGILIKGLKGIDPEKIAKDLSSDLGIRLFVAVIGYGTFKDQETEEFVLSNHIEKAVSWRNDPNCAGKIVVFIKNDSDKLHSLAEFDSFSVTDVTKYLISLQKTALENTPTQNFWDALAETSEFYSLNMIISFIDGINGFETTSNAIASNMWRLNLLSDKAILGTKNDQKERLKKNRDLILAIGQLSEESRKKLSRALSSKKYKEKGSLQEAYKELKNYYKYGKQDTLQKLTFELVEELFSASKETGKNKPAVVKLEDPTTIDGGGDEFSPNAPIKTKELGSIVSNTLVDGDDEDQEDLKRLIGELKKHYDQDDEDNKDIISSIGGAFGDRQIVPDDCQSDLRKLVGQVCNKDVWGALLTTDETVLKDAISGDYENLEPLCPNEKHNRLSANTGIEGDVSLFDFIERFDQKFKDGNVPNVELVTPIIEKLIDLRQKMIANTDMILSYPTLLFGADDTARQELVDYIKAWADLYHALSNNDIAMRTLSGPSTTFISRAILSLDILYIKTPKEWKAILLPMHPLYLWRYYEVFKNFTKDRKELSKDDAEALKEVLNKLPQLLSFVIVNEVITGVNENKVLPCSGNIEMLPTFENKTNRYLGDDGTDSIPEVLPRWLGFAPYTKNEVRLCSVDAPDLIGMIRDIKKVMDEYSIKKVVLDVYLTRGQNGNNELSKLDYSGKDYEIGDFIRQGRISVSIKNVDSAEEVKKELTSRPVHVAFYFDQSSYTITYGPMDKDLYINPLVITYDYDFDTIEQKGNIYPSCEMDSGLIGDYHKLMKSADMISNDQSPRPSYNGGVDVTAVVSTIKDEQTQWLVAADRDTNNYDPKGAIPIGEVQYDKRMVNVWTSENSRVISDYQKLLRSYNLNPTKEILNDLLRNYGHIATSGWVNIPKSGADPNAIDNKKKGLIGTLFAASWFTKKHPNSLVASLDDDRARIWLNDSKYGNERADLVGLYFDSEENTLHIQPIEVKTRDDSPDAVIEKDETDSKKWKITGHAADQVASVVSILNDIFNSPDQTDMFISARREVLKFQIVTECFRNIHNVDWQSQWCQILKQAFKNPANRSIKVDIDGLLIHIKLSDASGGKEVKCVNPKFEDIQIVYELLTAEEIQKIIFGDQAQTSIIQKPDFDETEKAEEDAIIDTDMAPEEVQSESDTEKVNEKISANPEVADHSKEEEKEQPIEMPKTETTGVSEIEIKQIIQDFKRSCQDYHISLKSCGENYVVGPSVIRIQFVLSRGQPLATLTNHLEDISREMRRSGVIVQEVKNSDNLMLDVPRTKRDQVLYKDVVDKITKTTSPEQLYFALGRTPNGVDLIKNLAELPHMLVGGSTGSGKSVFLFTMLASFLKSHPKKEDMTLILSSSKMEDFIHFEGLPHLYSGHIISDAIEATSVIKDVLTKESEERGAKLAEARVANIIEYNKKMETKMAPIVVVIDEFADLADQLDSKKERELFYKQVQRIAQTGRSRGIHLVICTQRPEAKIVPPTTKAQLPARLALRVPDGISSRMIIDTPDAQYLQKYGDMIYKDSDQLERTQGYLITIDELDEIVNWAIEQNK